MIEHPCPFYIRTHSLLAQALSYLILGISVHNVAMDLGAVEIFFIVVVVALLAYVVWRLVVRPRR